MRTWIRRLFAVLVMNGSDTTKLPCHHLIEKQYLMDIFSIFPWDKLPEGAVGFDLGSGSGRWAQIVAPRVGKLHLIDPSLDALNVARHNLQAKENCEFHLSHAGSIPLSDGTADFGYSLGVLHHVPDALDGLRQCARKLKKGGPIFVIPLLCIR